MADFGADNHPAANRSGGTNDGMGRSGWLPTWQTFRMSPKSRGRKKAVRGRARPVPVRQLPSAARLQTGSDRPRRSRPDGMQDLIESLRAALLPEANRFRSTLTDVDPLNAELYATQMLAGQGPGGVVDASIGLGMIAARYPEPHVAAMVVAVDSLRSNMPTRQAVSELSHKRVPLPGWHDQLNDVTVGRAWHCQDLFDEQETVLVSFYYGEREHAFLIETARCPNPQVQAIRFAGSAAELLNTLDSPEEISPQQARTRLDLALTYATDPATDPADVALLPLLRQRLQRLPEPAPTEPVEHTKQDRATAVENFLTDTASITGVDDETLRFWAEVMVGFTALHDSAPTRIGPLWLSAIFTLHVPGTFDLNSAQRAALQPAVTAWAAWAGHREGLPAAALGQLETTVVEIATTYDAVYDDPKWVPIRCYLSDVAALTRDCQDLLPVLVRRSQAVPMPSQRPPDTRSLLASDPAQRQQILLAIINDEQDGEESEVSQEFDNWREAYLRISEDLWNDTSPELGQMVLAYLDGHAADPDLLSALAEIALQYPDDPEGFLKAARSELPTPDEF
jgi:hypothetical protein